MNSFNQRAIIRGFLNADQSLQDPNLIEQTNKNFKIIRFKQVHGADIKLFQSPQSIDRYLNPEEFDGGLLFVRGAILVIQTADCVPIQLVSTSKDWIAHLHCGWKSVQRGIIENFFKIIASATEKPNSIEVWLGPSICARCYEVDHDLVEYFTPLLKQYGIRQEQIFDPVKPSSNRYFFDLKKLILNLLTNYRIHPGLIHSSNVCTRCDPAFNSYRLNRTKERNINYLGWS